MLDSFLTLQSFGYFGGGTIGNLLNQWSQAGVFSYVIPFLLIFALTYGILSKMSIFGESSKAINAIISLSVGFMALQLPTVSVFFSQIFPAMGVGLAVILVLLVITGFWTNDKKNEKWLKFMAFASIAVVLAVFFSGTSSSNFGWGLGYGFRTLWGIGWGNALLVIAVVGAIVWTIGGTLPKSKGLDVGGSSAAV